MFLLYFLRFPDDLGEPNGDKKLCATFRKFFEAWGKPVDYLKCGQQRNSLFSFGPDVTRDALPPFLIVEALRSHYPQFASKVRVVVSVSTLCARCLHTLAADGDTPTLSFLY